MRNKKRFYEKHNTEEQNNSSIQKDLEEKIFNEDPMLENKINYLIDLNIKNSFGNKIKEYIDTLIQNRSIDENKLNELNNSNYNLTIENRELKSKLNEMEDKFDILEAKINTIFKNLNIGYDNSTIDYEFKELKNFNSKSSKKIRKLNSKLKEIENKFNSKLENNDIIKNFTHKINQLENENSNLSNEIIELKRNRDEIQKKIFNLDHFHSDSSNSTNSSNSNSTNSENLTNNNQIKCKLSTVAPKNISKNLLISNENIERNKKKIIFYYDVEIQNLKQKFEEIFKDHIVNPINLLSKNYAISENEIKSCDIVFYLTIILDGRRLKNENFIQELNKIAEGKSIILIILQLYSFSNIELNLPNIKILRLVIDFKGNIKDSKEIENYTIELLNNTIEQK